MNLEKRSFTPAFWIVAVAVVVSLSGCQKDSKPVADSQNSIDHASETPLQPDSSDDSLAVTPVKASAPGSETCRGCHEDRFQSYQRSDHSRSMRFADLSAKKQTTFLHPPSQRSFQIYERDATVWHKQFAHFPQPGQSIGNDEPTVPLGEFPVKYVMGSGQFVEAFILQDGRYLLQSAPGWYTKTDAYDMSPGYEGSHHLGLTRVVDSDCLFCHVGSLQEDDWQKPVIGELAIGCQRCHGSGEEHVAHYQNVAKNTTHESSSTSDELSNFQDPIIHPANLSRRHSESICAQCHLQADFVVYPRGRKLWDFKPGEDFEETRMTYEVLDPAASAGNPLAPAGKTFVGHFAQMWQSQCYLGSDTMTCISCHNPHHTSAPDDVLHYQRQMCVQCHVDDDACGKPLNERIELQDNHCVACHMPRVASEIPHSATTNHRIAVYDENADAKSVSKVATPKPDHGGKILKRLAPPGDTLDTERADLVAAASFFLEDVERTGGGDQWSELPRLESALIAYAETNPTDAVVHTRLAQLYYQQSLNSSVESGSISESLTSAQEHAKQALAIGRLSASDRLAAQKVLAEWYDEIGDYRKSIQFYERLTRSRRVARDHYNLGIAYGKQADFAAAEAAFREAIRIDGGYELPYRSLSVLYRSADPELAARMRLMSELLERQNESP